MMMLANGVSRNSTLLSGSQQTTRSIWYRAALDLCEKHEGDSRRATRSITISTGSRSPGCKWVGYTTSSASPNHRWWRCFLAPAGFQMGSCNYTITTPALLSREILPVVFFSPLTMWCHGIFFISSTCTAFIWERDVQHTALSAPVFYVFRLSYDVFVVLFLYEAYRRFDARAVQGFSMDQGATSSIPDWIERSAEEERWPRKFVDEFLFLMLAENICVVNSASRSPGQPSVSVAARRRPRSGLRSSIPTGIGSLNRAMKKMILTLRSGSGRCLRSHRRRGDHEMAIRITCSGCQEEVVNDTAGKTVQCPSCRTKLIESAEPSAAARRRRLARWLPAWRCRQSSRA